MPDRLCLWALLIRLTTGASWVDIEAILDHQVSDTTLRARRDEWIAAGVFEQLRSEALAAFDRIIGLDLTEVALDGSLHKAPYGGEGTGPNPTDRAKSGWKWSVAVDRHGVPIGWIIDGANRNDVRMLVPTLEAIAEVGLLADIETLHLDRGYDYGSCVNGSPATGSTMSTSNVEAPRNPARSSPCVSGCAGSLRRPTRGGRTTDSCAATPTAETGTDTPRSASPPSSSSSANSSTGATAGARSNTYPLQVLSLDPPIEAV